MISVVIPAHNEEPVIARLLTALAPPGPGTPDDARLQVVVVCNGCTDGTASVARRFSGVTVIETPKPSKAAAQRLGDDAAEHSFPRVYVDADVEIGRQDVLALAAALEEPGILAASPERRLPRGEMSLLVRCYYDVWESLPAVRTGLFGRGVVALSREGYERIRALPERLSDDLVMSSALDAAERRVVRDASVTVHPPHTFADLVRRRVRAATGTHQVYEQSPGTTSELPTDSRTTRADLVRIVRHRPLLLFRLPVFLAVAVIARRRSAQAVAAGDFSTWLRDESSRRTAP